MGHGASKSARPTFACCPRPVAVSGAKDWFVLANAAGLVHACPDCYKTSIAPMPLASGWSKISSEEALICQFSQWWIRIGWMWISYNNFESPELICELGSIALTDGGCVAGQMLVRSWVTFKDPQCSKNSRVISRFQACPFCAANLSTIFPELAEVLVKGGAPTSGVCNLMPPSRMATEYLGQILHHMYDVRRGIRQIAGLLVVIKRMALANSKQFPTELPRELPERNTARPQASENDGHIQIPQHSQDGNVDYVLPRSDSA
jgi:hypothetical protein